MNQITDPTARARRITRTSYVGIGANILLAGFKAAVGLLSNSVAIVLDAVNNLTDALSSVLTILGVKLARRPPDEKHPFGYGRIEYFSAIAIAALVLAAGVGSLGESVKKIVHPEPLIKSPISTNEPYKKMHYSVIRPCKMVCTSMFV